MRVVHAANPMLPNLRVILAAMIATCVAVLALSAGMVGTRDPAKNLADLPDVSRALVRQAIVEEPEWQQFRLLAYSRRADELLRLRDLPATPVRAVVEYAEEAQARAAESGNAPAAPLASLPTDSAAASAPSASENNSVPPVLALAPAATSCANAPPAADSASVAASPAYAPPPAATGLDKRATADQEAANGERSVA
jgi:hypothetical protein